MAKINEQAFAEKIAEYISLSSLESTIGDEHPIISKTKDALMRTYDVLECGKFGTFKMSRYEGIYFGYNTTLVMKLIACAYRNFRRRNIFQKIMLSDTRQLELFSESVASAMQTFAEPQPSGEYNLCYPHFLLHGLDFPTIEEIAAKIENNARIIYETEKERELFAEKYIPTELGKGIVLGIDFGQTDDYFGIASFLYEEGNIFPSSCTGYLAKVSFFTDRTNDDIYVITVQGQRSSSRIGANGIHIKDRKLGGHYDKYTRQLGMDPRTFNLLQVMGMAQAEGYKGIKVILPECHPMFIEGHNGFIGKYENAIIAAGVDDKNYPYLETRLEIIQRKNFI